MNLEKVSNNPGENSEFDCDRRDRYVKVLSRMRHRSGVKTIGNVWAATENHRVGVEFDELEDIMPPSLGWKNQGGDSCNI